MAQTAAAYFDDAAGYDAFMRPWSRAASTAFLDWLGAGPHLDWLEIGCGTGALTQSIRQRNAPASLVAIDTSAALVDRARQQGAATRPALLLADACALPFAHRTFDVVVAGLVLNFIAAPATALREARRVARRGATIAAYVWDFSGGRSPGDFLGSALRAMGIEVEPLPGADGARMETLRSVFDACGLRCESRELDVTLEFADAHAMCDALTPRFGPRGKLVSSLPRARRDELDQALRARARRRHGGRLACCATAHAVKGVKRT